MKIILYYLLLLIFIALFTGFLVSKNQAEMSMTQTLSASALLVLYTVTLSMVGESYNPDERDILHRNLSNRAGLIAGITVLSVGVLYQLFTHQLNYWLLAGLIAINLTKIVSLIYLNYRK
ncbi:MAG: hypothetical protein HY397_02770 [Candidatus Doudnabacteria bacterium]|nr:hypothetical protein [Candidatus Doudnabacteria bacterium]